jgi:hypothetical protein
MIEFHPHPTDPNLVVLKTTPRYIAKHSDEDLQAAVLAERQACFDLVYNYEDTYHHFGLCKRAAELIKQRGKE